MRKAALKTYLYEIIFILIYKLSMDIFLRVSYFVYFLLWILSVIIMIYLFPYLILLLIGNHYLFVKLDPEKYILIIEKIYKMSIKKLKIKTIKTTSFNTNSQNF